MAWHARVVWCALGSIPFGIGWLSGALHFSWY